MGDFYWHMCVTWHCDSIFLLDLDLTCAWYLYLAFAVIADLLCTDTGAKSLRHWIESAYMVVEAGKLKVKFISSTTVNW